MTEPSPNADTGRVICRFCGNAIKSDPYCDSLPRMASPTGWMHDSLAWLGRRCPDGSRYAQPPHNGS